jgi:hypothetical protein
VSGSASTETDLPLTFIRIMKAPVGWAAWPSTGSFH